MANKHAFSACMLIALGSLTLSGCGGGGGSASNVVTDQPVPVIVEPTVEPIAISYSMTSNSIQMNAEIWKKSFTGAGVNVAVLDSGLRTSGESDFYHLGNVENVRYDIDGSDNIVKNPDTSLSNGNHGDDIAQIVASENYGMATGATIHHGIISDIDRYTERTSMFKGVEWALNQNADIINLSFGYGGLVVSAENSATYANYENIFFDIKERLILDNVALVHSAGNNASSTSNDILVTTYFSDIVKSNAKGQLLIVGATYDNETLASFSNYAGTDLDVQDRFVLAPAYSIVASGGSLGTSGAAANISGALALMKERWNSLGGRELTNIILDTADDAFLNYDVAIHGQGVVDMLAAFSPIGVASIPYESQNLSLSAASVSLPAGFDSVSVSSAFVDSYDRDFTLVYDAPIQSYHSPVDSMVTGFQGVDAYTPSVSQVNDNTYISYERPGTSHASVMSNGIAFLDMKSQFDRTMEDSSVGYVGRVTKLGDSIMGFKAVIPRAGQLDTNFPERIGASAFFEGGGVRLSTFFSNGESNNEFYGSQDRSIIGASLEFKADTFSVGVDSSQDSQAGDSLVKQYQIQTNKLYLGTSGSVLDGKVKIGLMGYIEASEANIGMEIPVSVGDGSLAYRGNNLRANRSVQGVSFTAMTDKLQVSAMANNIDQAWFVGYSDQF
jgi:hypothetical protein